MHRFDLCMKRIADRVTDRGFMRLLGSKVYTGKTLRQMEHAFHLRIEKSPAVFLNAFVFHLNFAPAFAHLIICHAQCHVVIT